jgi:hypothetical protein
MALQHVMATRRGMIGYSPELYNGTGYARVNGRAMKESWKFVSTHLRTLGGGAFDLEVVGIWHVISSSEAELEMHLVMNQTMVARR